MSTLHFAAIADDFTGATDLAGMLVRAGLRTTQAIGVRGLQAVRHNESDAIVVALRTRSVEPSEAIAVTLEAAELLLQMGAERLYFKYCSTFDSTPRGNIGPVAEALQAHLKAPFVPFVPAFPDNGRRVFQGHLFVGDRLLHESGMQLHPLNPMYDANLVRVLSVQARAGVALVDHDLIRRGPAVVAQALLKHAANGTPLLIFDAIDNDDLAVSAAALEQAVLITGGSALGLHLAKRLSETQHCAGAVAALSPRAGRAVILAGSCSQRTQEQILHFDAEKPALRLGVERIAEGIDVVEEAVRWFERQPCDCPVLIYSSPANTLVSNAPDDPEKALSVGRTIEKAFGCLARRLVARGVTRLLIAGGETSGAVVEALGISRLRVGAEIAPGLPWTQVVGNGPAEGVCLALKSGNFGAADLFINAFDHLDRQVVGVLP